MLCTACSRWHWGCSECRAVRTWLWGHQWLFFAFLFVELFASRVSSHCKHDMGTLLWLNAFNVLRLVWGGASIGSCALAWYKGFGAGLDAICHAFIVLPYPLRAVKDCELFCPRTPLIKTVMRLFTPASNYSQLWLCSIDYDSHE